ncbi:MAG TPA: hypothetical protein VMV66_03525, partial [Candidatus Humimicrobiaceae bacterium]|nr:hypothetical protein [Candidatus Humimicrobiaceae bacterium]
MKKKILLGLVAAVVVVGGIATMSAYEAHVINVTAHIENALSVPTKHIAFGTVFPQEKLNETIEIMFSESFTAEDRVDDIAYKIVQKPKFKGFLKTDVLFAFDTTGSMGPAIDDAKANAVAIMDALELLNPDVAFGVVHFEDYDFFPYGGSGKPDSPYTLDLSVTPDTTAVAAAIAAQILGIGGDGPQSYTRVMYESYSDAAIAWRGGAQQIVIILGDNVTHDDDLTSDPIYGTAPWGGGPWVTGYPDSYWDPGRDGIHDTADDLDFQPTLKGMADNNIMLYFLSYAHPIDYTANWDWWCGKTGGKAVDATSYGNIVDAIRDLFEYNFLCPHISKTKNLSDPDAYQPDIEVQVPHEPDAIAEGY